MLKRAHSEDFSDENEPKRRPKEEGIAPADSANDVSESENDDKGQPFPSESKEEVSCSSGSSEVGTGTDSTGWPRSAGRMRWVESQFREGVDPMQVLHRLMPDLALPEDLDAVTLWKLVVQVLTEPEPRQKLSDINTLEDVVSLLRTRRKIMVLTGAGVSVSCGIPDFRSRNGVYARLAMDYPDLPNPQAMFDISYFRHNPQPFYKFAKEIYPGQFKPSISHRFVALLERRDQLLRNYTQNIDTLEMAAGISRVVLCHGSFATASCTRCKHSVDCEVIRGDIMEQVIPRCPKCSPEGETPAIMKPDIVFFGEGLPDSFHDQIDQDQEKADLLIVIGSSLKVRPVALIPHCLPPDVPQILINRERLPQIEFDVELLGNCDDIVRELCTMLGSDWLDDIGLSEGTAADASTPLVSPQTIGQMSEAALVSPRLHEECDARSPRCLTELSQYKGDEVITESGTGESPLTEKLYEFCPPNVYIFPGAELPPDSPLTSSSRSRSEHDDEEHCLAALIGVESPGSPVSDELGNTVQPVDSSFLLVSDSVDRYSTLAAAGSLATSLCNSPEPQPQPRLFHQASEDAEVHSTTVSAGTLAPPARALSGSFSELDITPEVIVRSLNAEEENS